MSKRDQIDADIARVNAFISMMDEAIHRIDYIRHRAFRGDMIAPCTEAMKEMYRVRDMLVEFRDGVNRRKGKIDTLKAGDNAG